MEVVTERTAALTIADFQVSQILIYWRIRAFISQQDTCANVLSFLHSSPIPASPCSTSQKIPSNRIRAKEGGKKGVTMKKTLRTTFCNQIASRFCSRLAHFFLRLSAIPPCRKELLLCSAQVHRKAPKENSQWTQGINKLKCGLLVKKIIQPMWNSLLVIN